jgi:hypothetical protein
MVTVKTTNTSKTMKDKQTIIDNLRQQLTWTEEFTIKQRKAVRFAEEHADFLATLEKADISLSGAQLDIDYPTHGEAVEVMKHFKAGKWEKQYGDETVTYLGEVGEQAIRIYCAKPPPHCKVIKTMVTIPEHVVPEHQEEQVKIVCNDENLDTTSTETPTA